MSESIRKIIQWAATGLFAWAFFTWSMPLGLLYVAVFLAWIAYEKKITPEELGAAWVESAGRETTEHEQTRATQIAHLVLQKLKGRRA